MTAATLLRDVKSLVREPYAWPGGYPKFLVMTDGGCLCHKCAKSEFRCIAQAAITKQNDGWRPDAVDINWEDSDLLCDHCGNSIECAYGP